MFRNFWCVERHRERLQTPSITVSLWSASKLNSWPVKKSRQRSPKDCQRATPFLSLTEADSLSNHRISGCAAPPKPMSKRSSAEGKGTQRVAGGETIGRRFHGETPNDMINSKGDLEVDHWSKSGVPRFPISTHWIIVLPLFWWLYHVISHVSMISPSSILRLRISPAKSSLLNSSSMIPMSNSAKQGLISEGLLEISPVMEFYKP